MNAQVPRHLNKRPLIAGLEPFELLCVAAMLVGSNIFAKMLEMSVVGPALVAGSLFTFLKLYKRGKPRGHFLHILRYQLKPRVVLGFPRRERDL